MNAGTNINAKSQSTPTEHGVTEAELVELFESQIGEIDIKHGNIIRGEVIEVHKDYVVINSELKSESIVPRFEFEPDEVRKNYSSWRPV